MFELPFFSVIVPTHRRAVLLERALASIKSQVCPVPVEVVVVSDMADPATDAVCTRMLGPGDMLIRRNGPPGPSISRNMALRLVRGQYVMFLDDDDAWSPDYLAQLLRAPQVQQGRPVFVNCTVVTERRLPTGPEQVSEQGIDLVGRLTPDVYVKNQIHMSCFALPHALIQGLEFDPYMRAYEDWDYLLSVFDREMPTHAPIAGSRIFEVQDETSDRRGQSKAALDFNAVLDYLYVYRRHSAPSPELRARRAELMHACGLSIAAELL